MTPLKEKAVIDAVFDLKSRVTRIEGLLEGLLANDTERVTLLRDLRAAVEHTRRRVYQKETLLQLVGAMALNYRDRDTRMEIVGPDLGDIERIAREIREAH